MPHQVAAEHMGVYDVIRAGFPNPNPARTGALIASAVSNIGSAQAILVLTFLGDGIYTVTSNLSIPANIHLWIPPGVTVTVASGITMTVIGPYTSYNHQWMVGAGTFVFSPGTTVMHEVGQLQTQTLHVRDPQAAATNRPSLVIATAGVAPNQPQLQFFSQRQPGTSGPSVEFVHRSESTALSWQIMQLETGNLQFRRLDSGPTMMFSGNGVGCGNIVPTHVLHMGADDAFKATTLWSVPSDSRLKTVIDDFTDGASVLKALPQAKRFTWNGKGGTVDDGLVHYGRIAQDVQPVAPYLIREYEDKLEPDDQAPTTLLSANDSPLIEVLINAVKELIARVEALEAAGPAVREAGDTEEEPQARSTRRRKE
jgi:hypothetical protein